MFLQAHDPLSLLNPVFLQAHDPLSLLNTSETNGTVPAVLLPKKVPPKKLKKKAAQARRKVFRAQQMEGITHWPASLLRMGGPCAGGWAPFFPVKNARRNLDYLGVSGFVTRQNMKRGGYHTVPNMDISAFPADGESVLVSDCLCVSLPPSEPSQCDCRVTARLTSRGLRLGRSATRARERPRARGCCASHAAPRRMSMPTESPKCGTAAPWWATAATCYSARTLPPLPPPPRPRQATSYPLGNATDRCCMIAR